MKNLTNLINKTKNTHKKLFEKFDYLYPASLALLTARALDNASTYLCLHKGDASISEGNPIVNYCIEQFGINAGLMLSEIPVLGMIGVASYANNICADSDKRAIRNLGSITLAGVSLLHIPVLINNFMIYF